MNGIPLINGNEYSWGDIACTVAGVVVTGITGIEYDDDQEMAEVYGAGSYPVARRLRTYNLHGQNNSAYERSKCIAGCGNRRKAAEPGAV
jgi:hypothetical protein